MLVMGDPHISDAHPRQGALTAPMSIEDRLKAVEKKVAGKKKDFYDKVGALSGIISGALVAAIGFYATQIYNSRSQAIELSEKERNTEAIELQTIEKFLPYINHTDPNRGVRLLNLYQC